MKKNFRTDFRYLYILTNKYNKVLYTGVTDDLSKRIHEHKKRLRDGFTKKYNDNKLVYFEIIDAAADALAREKEIKGWLRKKKIDLINSKNPEWKELG